MNEGLCGAIGAGWLRSIVAATAVLMALSWGGVAARAEASGSRSADCAKRSPAGASVADRRCRGLNRRARCHRGRVHRKRGRHTRARRCHHKHRKGCRRRGRKHGKHGTCAGKRHDGKPPAGGSGDGAADGSPGAPAPAPAPSPGLPSGDFFVSPHGDDAASGGESAPLRTIDRALQLATGGETVVVLPGSYPAFRDTRRRAAETKLIGIASPEVAGAGLMGSSNLTISGFVFTGKVLIRRHPTFADRNAQDITIRDNELTSATPLARRCLTIRDGAERITVAGNWIHDCRGGIDGPGYGFDDPADVPLTAGITIRDNLLERFRADGIQFAHWRDVEIADNTIRTMQDPDHVEHNDGIQIMGDSARVRILRNVIAHSNGQLIIVQGAVGGPNDDILLRDNLAFDSATYAWQLGDVTDLRVYNNTVWKSKYGGILLRPGAYASVANNIADFIGSSFGSGPGSYTYFDYNLMGRTWNTVLPHSGVGIDPGFVDAADDDYRLRPDSIAVGRGNPDFAGPTDLAGNPRPDPPSLGALEPGSALP